jgi:hypothetical protein
MVFESAYMQLDMLQIVSVCAVSSKLDGPHMVMPRKGLNTRLAMVCARPGIATKCRSTQFPYNTSGALLVASCLYSPFYIACAGCCFVLLLYSSSPGRQRSPWSSERTCNATYSSPPCLGVKSHDRVNIWKNRLP